MPRKPASKATAAAQILPAAVRISRARNKTPQGQQVQDQDQTQSLASTTKQRRALNAWARDDPTMLAGDALRDFANERGIAMSELRTMSDEKVREQLRYILAHTYGG